MYKLSETPSADSAQRTEWNVRDSDGTVIFSMRGELMGGSKKTAECAQKWKKPCVHLCYERDGEAASHKLQEFLNDNKIAVLNVAGSRASEEAGIYQFTTRTLEALASLLTQSQG